MSALDRVPPNSLEAEQAVIGAAFVDREAMEIAVGIVAASDFYAHTHETIFAALVDLFERREPLDRITVAGALRDRGLLERVGGIAYLGVLADAVPTAASCEFYARIVRDKAVLRGLVRAGTEIAAAGYDGEVDPEGAVERAEFALRRATDTSSATGGTSLREAVHSSLEATGLRRIGYGEKPQHTPWPSLNESIGGFYAGQLAVWPSAPKMGKTALLTQLAAYVAEFYGPVAFFSLEMGKDALTRRLLALYSGVPVRRQMLGDFDTRQANALAAAAEQLKLLPIRLFDLRDAHRVVDIRREMRALARDGGLKAVIVDHVNFLSDVDGVGGDRSSKHDRLDRVYRTLLHAAQDLGCVMHAVQHVNRAGMAGPPSLRDIRDGGNPEGHAHAVIFPYRPHPMGTKEERAEGQLIVAASRDGEAGVIEGMEFVGYRGLWMDPKHRGERPWFEPDDFAQTDAFDGAA